MPKGMHTAGVAVLLERPAEISAVRRLLDGFDVARMLEPQSEGGWMGRDAAVLLAMDRKQNGAVVVDVVGKPWPDSMGDPQQDPMLFGAWSMGWFGPFAWPGALARSPYWSPDQAKSTALVEQHRAFVRIRATYAGGNNPDAPIIPENYNPAEELLYITNVARALLALPEALAYFNPNGEVLATAVEFEESYEHHRSSGLPPLSLWSAVRQVPGGDGDRWTAMDTVGMGQLDIPDHQACFATAQVDPAEVAGFLYGASDHVRQNGPAIKDGDTTDGPGGRWRARLIGECPRVPPRDMYSWTPVNGPTPPPAFTGEPRKRPFWKFWGN